MATGGKEQRETSATMSFPIVGIGASAGGLEAVSELLASLPAESGLALLLVQHLDPAHESLLAEILAKKTAMPVSKVTEGMVLTITDNGLGIAPANLPRIFDLFVQADTSLDHSQGGLGIGLSLVRAIVESHGGRVEAKSPGLGQGSEFSVRLPLLPEAPTTLKAQPTPESLEQPSASRRILVVDDNQDSVDSLAVLLQIWGHTVEIAYDTSSALEAARTFRPEIALLDIGLPGMTGLELARQLRALPGLAGLYLVAVTGYRRKEDWQATLASGFHCHIVKSVDPEALKTLIASFEMDKFPVSPH